MSTFYTALVSFKGWAPVVGLILLGFFIFDVEWGHQIKDTTQLWDVFWLALGAFGLSGAHSAGQAAAVSGAAAATPAQ